MLKFTGDSGAHIVRGLIAVLLTACSGKPVRQLLEVDALALFDRLGLREHLAPLRSNALNPWSAVSAAMPTRRSRLSRLSLAAK